MAWSDVKSAVALIASNTGSIESSVAFCVEDLPLKEFYEIKRDCRAAVESLRRIEADSDEKRERTAVEIDRDIWKSVVSAPDLVKNKSLIEGRVVSKTYSSASVGKRITVSRGANKERIIEDIVE